MSLPCLFLIRGALLFRFPVVSHTSPPPPRLRSLLLHCHALRELEFSDCQVCC